MSDGCLLDTSFLIRLLTDTDPLHKNARDYYKYFLEKFFVLKVSTITVAEFCVRGTIDMLPLRDLQIVPFNVEHARRSADFARKILDEKGNIGSRTIVINDLKLFGQADSDKGIQYFATSDGEAKKLFDRLAILNPNFQFVDIQTPCNETFGFLGI